MDSAALSLDESHPTRLDSFPQEVHDLILQHITSKPLLRSLLLLSRKLYHAVLPWLYRSVSFKIDSSVGTYQANYKLLRMADKENPGLLHIESVTLSVQDELTRVQNRIADYPDAIQLLQAIPRDTLLYFRWNSWHTVPTQLLQLLWSRQRDITNIELIESHESSDKVATVVGCSYDPADDTTFFPNAASLRIADVRKATIPLIALQLLQYRPNIETLELDFWNVRLGMDRTSKTDGLLKKLLDPPFQLRPPCLLAIRTLHLFAVDLRQNCDLLLTALDTTVLSDLVVVSCLKPNILFTQMSRLPAHARPHLERLVIFHSQQSQERAWVAANDPTDRVTKSINDLLLSTEDTISNLWIVMRGIHGYKKLLSPLVSGIQNHGRSLIRLTVDIRSHVPPFVDQQCAGWFPKVGWERLCASMTELRFLCVPFPPVVANEYCTSRREHRDYLASALQIPTLKTLISSTYPYPHHTTLFQPDDKRSYSPFSYIQRPYHVIPSVVPHDFYLTCLSRLVDKITKLRSQLIKNPTRDLDIVGFGLQERNHFMPELDYGLRPLFFVPSRTVTTGREERGMRFALKSKILRSELGESIVGFRNIDSLAKNRRKTDNLEIHP